MVRFSQPKTEKLTADYRLIGPLICQQCQQPQVYFKYGRFSDMCICENCGLNLPDFKYYQQQPEKFTYQNLLGVFYGIKKPRPLLIILAGYGCDANKTFKMSRYAKWSDHLGYNLLFLADQNLYWDHTFQSNIQVIHDLLHTTTYSDLFQSTRQISILGHSNGGIMMATLAATMPFKNVIFMSGFVNLAIDIVQANLKNYHRLGFHETNQYMQEILQQHQIQTTTIEIQAGHNMRAGGGKMFTYLQQH